MKKKKINKGLKLEKETIAILTNDAKSKIKGGCHEDASGTHTPMCELTRLIKEFTDPNA